jgi:hypothetical protein
MAIRESEEQLFIRWRPNRPGFVADGVADEAEYLATSPKLLFVLKEVNDLGGGNWDLRQFMREGGRSQTWNNITRWIEGIRRLPQDIPWCDLENIDEERRRRALRSIAAINLKKSPGGHTTDPVSLMATAAEDKTFLNQQFSLYEPDVVICCGTDTSYTFHLLVESVSQPNWRTTRRGIKFHEFKPRKYVVVFAHPEARVADCLLYYGLIDAFREILYFAT